MVVDQSTTTLGLNTETTNPWTHHIRIVRVCNSKSEVLGFTMVEHHYLEWIDRVQDQVASGNRGKEWEGRSYARCQHTLDRERSCQEPPSGYRSQLRATSIAQLCGPCPHWRYHQQKNFRSTEYQRVIDLGSNNHLF